MAYLFSYLLAVENRFSEQAILFNAEFIACVNHFTFSRFVFLKKLAAKVNLLSLLSLINDLAATRKTARFLHDAVILFRIPHCSIQSLLELKMKYLQGVRD